MITAIITACLIFVIIGVAGGALVFGLCSIGTLVALGFELGLWLLPIILLYLIARAVWRMTTSKKEEKSEE